MCDDKVYEVERLVSIRKNASTKKHCGIRVLIKWKGFSDKESTWEPIENLNQHSAISMLEELEEIMKGNSVKRSLVKEAIKILSNDEIKPLDKPEKAVSKVQANKLQDSDRSKINNKKSREPSVSLNPNTNFVQSNITVPPSQSKNSLHNSNVKNSSQSPINGTPLNSYNFQAPEQRRDKNRLTEDSGLDQMISNQFINDFNTTPVAEPNYKIGRKQFEVIYTRVYRKSVSSDLFTITKIRIDTMDKSVQEVEEVDIMDELQKSDNKEALVKICVESLLKTEQRFQKLAEQTIKSIPSFKSKQLSL
jgi:hypothetical protein